MNETEDQEYPKYAIDLDWHRQKGRSLSVLFRSRIRLMGGDDLERKLEGKDEKAILASLRGRQSSHPDFIPPDLPILEAIFRVYLQEGNQPLSPVDLKDRLMTCWSDVGAYKDVEPPILKRLLDHDQYYGIRQVSPQE
ncbi:MAG: hypothetical protein ACE5JL_04765 [Dehalococcoidia bacterium]